MNEKEIIEEMASLIKLPLENWLEDTGAIPTATTYYSELMSCINDSAEVLYNEGYRKIPEGSVVLTSEQYSNYLILQTNEEWLKNKVTELQADNERLYKNLGKFKESVRKETAKEIFVKVINELMTKKERAKRFYSIKESIGVDMAIKKVKEIAKQYGVKVEE